jgi:hypothetical protein
LADFPHSPSPRPAKAYFRRDPSSDSPAARNSMGICAHKMEKMLMDWNNGPSPAVLRDLPRKQVYIEGAKSFPVK